MSVYAGDYVHWVKIIVKDENHNQLKGLLWEGLPFQTRSKFDWYFKYRAALIVVANPRYKVEVRWGHTLVIPREEYEKKERANRIRSKRSLVTKMTNRLNAYKRLYNEIFPIEDDDKYKRAMAKLSLVKQELKQLEKNET